MKSQRAKLIYSPVAMVLFALFLRIAWTLVTRSYHFGSLWDLFEMANLSRSLATGHGFSDPYVVATGPSALTGPVYPWVVSLIFRAFGVFSDASGFVIVVFNSVFSALTCWTIYRIARRLFNERVAVWSGWVWALWPFAIHWSVDWVWETSLSTFLLSLMFLRTLEMEDDNRVTSWAVYALLWGLVGLTSTSMLSWLPFAGCWLAYQLHRRGKAFVAPVLLSAAIFWMTLTPWLVRNYFAFGKFVFLRDNFGNELRAGNNPESEGWKVDHYDSGRDPVLLELYKKIGEPAINAKMADDAKAWIAEHPQRFLTLCAHRFIFFWTGSLFSGGSTGLGTQLKNLLFALSSLLGIAGLVLALKGRVHGVFLFAALIVFYPLTYYISVPELRYRHAIEPQLLILAVFLLCSLAARLLPQRQPADEVVLSA